MDRLLVSLLGVGLIAVIYWFFFGKKEEAVEAHDKLAITVNGGYKPSLIKIKQGQTVSLVFTRKDPNACLEEIIFPDYKIKEYLPLNQPVTITLSPPHLGKSGFHCSMNMFHGKIKVV